METRCADDAVEIILPTSVVDIVCAEDDAAPDCRSVGSSGVDVIDTSKTICAADGPVLSECPTCVKPYCTVRNRIPTVRALTQLRSLSEKRSIPGLNVV